MAGRMTQQTWKTVLIIAVVLLAIGLVMSGAVLWYIGLLIVLLGMAGGALLSRTLGPPDQ